MRARCFAIFALAASLLSAIRPALGNGVIQPGFDLFTTLQPTAVGGFQFQGLPLGTFNFGGSVGLQSTGATDTIIQRLASASAPGPSVIPIEIVALHLQTT